MNELALFAGAGGGILGGHLLGWRTVCAVEIEDYPRRVLLQRQADGILPRFPIWDDVCTFDGKPWRGKVDVVSGGFPCQDISCASGKATDIEGKRSGLWKEMARIIGEVRPRYAFVENSPMLVRRGLAMVLSDLAEMGYDAKWGVLGGQHSGGHCKGERLWIVSSPMQVGRERRHGSSRECCEDEGDSGQRSSGLRGSIKDNERSSSQEKSPPLEGATTQSILREEREEVQRGIVRNTPPQSIRVGYEVADRVDRLEAIGNGQDPFVAKLAFETLNTNH